MVTGTALELMADQDTLHLISTQQPKVSINSSRKVLAQAMSPMATPRMTTVAPAHSTAEPSFLMTMSQNCQDTHLQSW